MNQINFLLPLLYYAEACNELARVNEQLRPCNKDSFEKVLQRWQAFGNIVSDLRKSNFPENLKLPVL